jgi:N-methylhydantoinase A/oxoprolinase/acetone carboxylase beta subunit
MPRYRLQPLLSPHLGPAIVEQMDTTTLIPEGAEAKVDKYGIITIEVV